MNAVLFSSARNFLRSSGRRALGSQRRLNRRERDIALVEREVLRARAAAVQMPHEDMRYWITYSSIMMGIALGVAWHVTHPQKTYLERWRELNASKQGFQGVKEPINNGY